MISVSVSSRVRQRCSLPGWRFPERYSRGTQVEKHPTAGSARAADFTDASSIRRDVVITLPYDFDTTARWRTIVKLVFTVVGLVLVAIGGALINGELGGASALALCLAILTWLLRRGRTLPMGAAGRLTARAIETRAVKVLWFALRVPAGRFSIDRFQSIAVVEQIVLPRPGGTGTNTGSVRLVGKSGTPDIEVAYGVIGEALDVARELAGLLGLEWRRQDAPGSRAIHVVLD